MTLGSAAILTHLQEQLLTVVSPYLKQALQDGHGLQVVLFVNGRGQVGQPKITITTGQKPLT